MFIIRPKKIYRIPRFSEVFGWDFLHMINNRTVFVLSLLLASHCKGPTKSSESRTDISINVIASHPHDQNAFTQGLFFKDGFLYESTGGYGTSSLRKIIPSTGEIIKNYTLEDRYFAEGAVFWNTDIIQLTWKSGIGLTYNETPDGFFLQDKNFTYATEGWGLTSDFTHLIMSDGSEKLYFLDPVSKEILRVLKVSSNGHFVRNLNELEYIDHQIYANIWMKNEIAIIDPQNGLVTARVPINPAELLGDLYEKLGPEDVLNGIAYEPQSKHIFITGKNWPKIFEITINK